MSRPFKVHELLKDTSDLEGLEEFAREPGRTVDECHEWLLAKGYVISRTSVWRWKDEFDDRCVEERLIAASGFAGAVAKAIEAGKPEAIAAAATMQINKDVLGVLARAQARGELNAKDVATCALALQRTALAASREEKSRADREKRDRVAVEEASKVAAEGASGGDVVNTIKKALGITQEGKAA